MIKFKLIILILCCITHLVTAETAFDLIDIGISAESIAIGSIELGCQTAQCLFTNPALLDNKVNWSLDTFQVKTVMDNYIRTFSLSKSYQNYVIGIGYNGTSIEGIQEGKDDFIEDQMEIDYHSYQYGSYYLSGKASIIDNFSMGLNLKYKDITLADISGSGFNSDIGIGWKRSPYQFSFSIHNILQFQRLNFSDNMSNDYRSEFYPLKLFLSGSKFFNYKDIKADIYSQLKYHRFKSDYHNNSPILYALGIKLNIDQLPYLELMLGHRTVPYLEKTTSRQSLGINLNLKPVKFSYAFEKSSVEIFNNHHYFSLSIFKMKSKIKFKKDQTQNEKEELIHIKGYDGKVYITTIKKLKQQEKERIKLTAEAKEKVRNLKIQLDKAKKEAEKQLKKAMRASQEKSKEAAAKIALSEKAQEKVLQLKVQLAVAEEMVKFNTEKSISKKETVIQETKNKVNTLKLKVDEMNKKSIIEQNKVKKLENESQKSQEKVVKLQEDLSKEKANIKSLKIKNEVGKEQAITKAEKNVKQLTNELKVAQKDSKEKVLKAEAQRIKAKEAQAVAEKLTIDLNITQKLIESIKEQNSSDQDELLKKAESKVNELKSKVDSANMTAQNLEKEAEFARAEAIKAKSYEKQLKLQKSIEMKQIQTIILKTEKEAIRPESQYTYTLVTGTFMSKKIADQHAKKQSNKGLYPRVVKEQTTKEGKVVNVYRLKLQEYKNLQEAKAKKLELNKLQIRNYILVQEKPALEDHLDSKKKRIK